MMYINEKTVDEIIRLKEEIQLRLRKVESDYDALRIKLVDNSSKEEYTLINDMLGEFSDIMDRYDIELDVITDELLNREREGIL